MNLCTRKIYESNSSKYHSYFDTIKYPSSLDTSSVTVFGSWDNYATGIKLRFSDSDNCFILKAEDIPRFTKMAGVTFYFTVEYEEECMSPHYPAINSPYGKVNELNLQSPSTLPLPIQKFSTVTHPRLNNATDISVLGSWDNFSIPLQMQYDGTEFRRHIPGLASGEIYYYYFVITTKTYEASTFYPKNSIATPHGNVGQNAEICFNPRCNRRDHHHRLSFFSSPDIVTVEVIGSWDEYYTPISLHTDGHNHSYLISKTDTNPPNIPTGKHTFIFLVTRKRELNKEAPLTFTAA